MGKLGKCITRKLILEYSLIPPKLLALLKENPILMNTKLLPGLFLINSVKNYEYFKEMYFTANFIVNNWLLDRLKVQGTGKYRMLRMPSFNDRHCFVVTCLKYFILHILLQYYSYCHGQLIHAKMN